VPFGVTTRFIAYRGMMPFFDLEVTIRKKPADPWPEAAWICLPFKLDSPEFRLGRLGGIVDPARDVVPGSNHHLFAIDTGVALVGADGRGVGVCPLDSPLVSLDTPGGWKYSRDFVPKKSVIFINLFNNQWTTNFRLWNEGTWTSRVRIWWWYGDRFDAEQHLIRPSLEARFPLRAVCVNSKAGKLPLSAAGLSVSRDREPAKPLGSEFDHGDVLVSAFAPNPDGPGTVLRLWEMGGKTGPAYVHLSGGLARTSVQPVDLRGRPSGAPIRVEDGTFEAFLTAFAPASFVLATAARETRP
jgi:alpha-mannosidase